MLIPQRLGTLTTNIEHDHKFEVIQHINLSAETSFAFRNINTL